MSASVGKGVSHAALKHYSRGVTYLVCVCVCVCVPKKHANRATKAMERKTSDKSSHKHHARSKLPVEVWACKDILEMCIKRESER